MSLIIIPNHLILVSLDSSFHQLSVDTNSSNSDFILPSNLTFDQGLFIFHQKSNVDFRGQLLLIYKSEFDNFRVFGFLWFLDFH